MATEYKLSYTAEEIDAKLGKIDELEEKLNNIEDEATDTTDTTKGVEIGTIVRIDDVSATEHEMDVSISGVDKPTAVTVRRCGKNLLTMPYSEGNSKSRNGVTFTVNADDSSENYGSISATGTTGTSGAQYYMIISDTSSPYTIPAGSYTISCRIKDKNGVDVTDEAEYSSYGAVCTIKNSSGTSKIYPQSYSNPNFTTEDGYFIYRFGITVPEGQTVDGLVFYPMLEYGSSASEWEKPQTETTFTPNSDGVVSGVTSVYPVSGITSVYPTTTLYTNVAGAVITCKYNTKANDEASSENTSSDTQQKWAGKKWVAVGDSITMDTWYTTKAYHTYISEETGITVVNLGKGGTGFAKTNNSGVSPYYGRINAETIPADTNVVTLMGGLNDLGAGLELGEITDSGTTTLCGCVNASIDAVYAVLPAVPLGIIIDPPAIGQNYIEGTTIAEYFEAIEEICRRRSIPCLNLFHCSGLRPWDETYRNLMYSDANNHGTPDGLHPNEEGHKVIAPKIKTFLETLIM